MMKFPCICGLLLVLGLAAGVSAQADPNGAPGPVSLRSTSDQASYAIGLSIGRQLKPNRTELNVAALLQGIRDILTDTAPRLSEQQTAAAMKVFEKQIQARFEQRRRILGESNKAAGAEFLAANKRREGVVLLPSGLQYQVLKSGTGSMPKLEDTVVAHYHGTLTDGTVFDSSIQRGEPTEFPVGGVIRGWTEALQRMHVGDKWRLFVPSELAYGPGGAGELIGPHAVLIFDVELLGIK